MKMVTVVIQGKEVQANLLNADVAKKIEDGFHKTLDRFNMAAKSKVGSEGIREQCQAVIDFVADIFGNDTAREIFGEETDLISCMDVLEEIMGVYPKQVNPIVAARAAGLKEKLEGAEKSDM